MGQGASHLIHNPKFKLRTSSKPRIFQPSEIKRPEDSPQYNIVEDTVNQLDPINYVKNRPTLNNTDNSPSKSFDSTRSDTPNRNMTQTAEVEISGVKPDINASFIQTVTAQELSDLILDRSDPLKPLYLRRIPKHNELSVGQNSIADCNKGKPVVNSGKFQVVTVKRPTVLLASENGVTLMRGIWKEMASLNQLGLITLIYNVTDPSAIHYCFELTEMLVDGFISDLIFIFGDPENSARQIAADSQVIKVLKGKTIDGAHVYVAGTPPFNIAIRHLVAELTSINSDVILYQDWYHALLVDRFD